MKRRTLSGRLEDLAPATLLRLVSATSPSGVLEIETEMGLLRLEVDRGRVPVPSAEKLEIAREVIRCRSGEFRFLPCGVHHADTEMLSLTAFAEAAGPVGRGMKLANLVDEPDTESTAPSESPKIHVLPAVPLSDPLDDLLTDLESEVSTDLILAEVGVMAEDPRIWQGAIERQWRRRGWKIHNLSDPDTVQFENLDLLVVHHKSATVRTGKEDQWLGLLRRAAEAESATPVIWVGPLADPTWVHQLIAAGVVFLMPPPQGDSGEVILRFVEDLSTIVDRQLKVFPIRKGPKPASGLSELVEAFLSESSPDHGLRSLLQLASESFSRGVVLLVGESSIQCRAGFGYPLDRNRTDFPRGVEVVERVICSGEALMEIAPDDPGVDQLAAVLGISRVPMATALIPLGRYGSVAGLLVADRSGDPLPGLDDLVVFAGRLGGAIVS